MSPHSDGSRTVASSVLITGGAGFIGSALASRLRSSGHRVVAVDSLHPQVHGQGRPATLDPEVELLTGDVSDVGTWDTALKLVQPDVVVHLAAETGTGQSLTEASRHAGVNVLGTARMLDAFTAAGTMPAHFVLASSRAVYGEGRWESDGTVFYAAPRTHDQLAAGRWDPIGPSGQPASPLPSSAADTEPRPTNIYAATKLAQEHILAAWTAARGSRLSVLRLQNVYGPGQALGNPYTGVLALFGRLAAEGKSIDVYEDGEILRDFVYIDDVADALCATIQDPPHDRRLVDLGSGSPVTILETARRMALLAGAPNPVVSGNFRDGDVRAASCDITAAHDEFGYRPAWDLDRGLKALLEWIGGRPVEGAA